MNSLLTSIEGMDEFVVTPAPNKYLVALRITPEQAEYFNGHERISVALEIMDSGSAGVHHVRTVADDNEPGPDLFPASDAEDFTPEQYLVLTAPEFEARVNKAVVDFYTAVKDDLDEYYNLCAETYGGSANIASLLALLTKE
jgi:hypothetical protein